MKYSQVGITRVGGGLKKIASTRIPNIVNVSADHGIPIIQIGSVLRNTAVALGFPVHKTFSPEVSSRMAFSRARDDRFDIGMRATYHGCVTGW